MPHRRQSKKKRRTTTTMMTTETAYKVGTAIHTPTTKRNPVCGAHRDRALSLSLLRLSHAQAMAKTEGAIIIAAICARFDLSLAPGQVRCLATMFVGRPKPPLLWYSSPAVNVACWDDGGTSKVDRSHPPECDAAAPLLVAPPDDRTPGGIPTQSRV